ncbi:MAG TPA: SCO family protein [Solirubrobacteraceae bacterium]|jgi:protein SCO1/2|nr:SCO family protein [Solirubrobacteraceae bacterium]
MLASVKFQRALMLILLALVGAIVFIIVTDRGPAVGQPSTHSEFDGGTMPAHLLAPDFTLTDENGHRVSLAADRGKVVVLTFIHSLCHDTCPFMVEQIKGALNDLPDNGSNVPAIGVSAAQAEDTPKNRKAFLTKHEMTGRLEFVNGSLPTMRRIWSEWHIQPVTPKVDHSTFVILIDKRGYERVGFPADQLTPEGLAHDIRVLERQS